MKQLCKKNTVSCKDNERYMNYDKENIILGGKE